MAVASDLLLMAGFAALLLRTGPRRPASTGKPARTHAAGLRALGAADIAVLSAGCATTPHVDPLLPRLLRDTSAPIGQPQSP